MKTKQTASEGNNNQSHTRQPLQHLLRVCISDTQSSEHTHLGQGLPSRSPRGLATRQAFRFSEALQNLRAPHSSSARQAR